MLLGTLTRKGAFMSDQALKLIPKGGYGLETIFDIVQHKYAGGGHPGAGGYIEVLEIKNPPGGRHGIIIHEENSDRGHMFSEWQTLEGALSAFDKYWGDAGLAYLFLPKLPLFIRRVICGNRTPWFYAKSEESIVGDLVSTQGKL